MTNPSDWASFIALPIIESARDAAKIYLALGLRVVPIPAGSKAPVINGWPDLKFAPGDFSDGCNIGVVLGEASGGLVDVDLDCSEAVMLAPCFLPATGAVFGRESKRASHWLYYVDVPPAGTAVFKDAERGTLVELRSTGGQTVFPPSRHSSERVTWDGCGNPSRIETGELQRRVQMLAVASLLARHWGYDGRHGLSLAVGGTLARAGYTLEEIGTIVSAVCQCAGDTEIEDRVRTAKDGAEHYSTGAPTVGLPTLSELLGESVARALKRILPTGTAEAPENQCEPERSQRERAIESLSGTEFWLTPGGEPYATIEVNGHLENHRIKGSTFRRIVTARVFAQEGRFVPRAAIEEALFNAEAQAAMSGRVYETHLRTAAYQGAIYIDLGCCGWRAIRVTPEGYGIVDQVPVKFIRPPGMQALPEPEPGGKLDDLRPLINVVDESDFRLLVASMLAALIPESPYPVLIVTGEQGTAKTTLSRIVKFMVDPHEADSRSPPKSEQDLFVGAGNGHVLVFDNISHIPAWFSDALCRIATGGAFAARELFTDKEESLIKAKRPVVLNGIPFAVDRPDLLDRAIVLILPVIQPDKRRDEKEYWGELRRIRPRLLGLLLTALSTALRRIDTVQLPSKPRMADLARWMTAAETAFGWLEGTFLDDFQERRTRSMCELADDVLVGTLVDVVAANGGELSKTATELLRILNNHVPPAERPRDWPKAANRLSGQIRALAPALRELGVEVDQSERRTGDNNRLIFLRTKVKTPPPPEHNLF